MPSEAETQHAILLALGARPDMRIWRANTGAARTTSGRLVRFGVTGQADILGLRLPHGQLIAIECKSPTGRQSKDQQRFEEMVIAMGGIYVLARSVQDVLDVLPLP